jgi:aminopeptidase N
MMLQSVRELLGDDLFLTNIKALYQNHINGIITADSFIGSLSRNTDKPVKELINSWINDKVYIP